jgi:hypothetical protein
MGRHGRCFLGLALAAAAGCSWSARPYAHDPLVRDGRGVWGDPVRAGQTRPDPPPEPAAPPAPPATPDPKSFAATE